MKENVYNTNQGCHGTRGGGWGHHSTLLLCRLWSLWVASTGVLSSIIYLVNTVVLAERGERTCKLKRMEKIDQAKKGEGPPTKRAWHVPGPWDREELSMAKGWREPGMTTADGMVGTVPGGGGGPGRASLAIAGSLPATLSFFNCSLVELQYCMSFRCTAKWYTYTHIHVYIYSFFDSFPLWVIIKYWIQFPVLYSKSPTYEPSSCKLSKMLT